MSFGVVVVGLGMIGMEADLGPAPETQVVSHARAFSRHPAFSLRAGVDPDAGRRARFAAVYGCPASAELAGLPPGTEADLVVVAAPTAAHAASVKAALSTLRPRALLCEKPLSHDLAEAREIVRLCREYDCRLFVNYVRRADPAVEEIRRRLAAGRIGLPLKGVAWYSKGIFHNGSHFFDLLQHWLGGMQSFRVGQRGRDWGGDPEPDCFVRFLKGDIAFLAAREECFSHYTVELVAPNGRLRYDLGGEKVTWQGAVASASAPGYTVLDPVEETIPNDFSRIQWHVADQLAGALQGRSTTLCTGEEALQVIEHLTAIKNAL